MSKNPRDTSKEEMENPEFKKEWDNLEVEFQIIKAMIDGRNENHLTQRELSDMTGIAQGDISKIENGNANPSIKTLDRLADALGKKLKVTFESKI